LNYLFGGQVRNVPIYSARSADNKSRILDIVSKSQI